MSIDLDALAAQMAAEDNIQGFAEYCREASEFHPAGGHAQLMFAHALVALEQYEQYLCRLSEVMGGKLPG